MFFPQQLRLKNKALLTQVVKAPLGTESHLPLQVVRVVRPRLQNWEPITDGRIRHGQFVLTWKQNRLSERQKQIETLSLSECRHKRLGISGALVSELCFHTEHRLIYRWI